CRRVRDVCAAAARRGLLRRGGSHDGGHESYAASRRVAPRSEYHSPAMKISLAGTGAMGVIHMKALGKIPEVEVVSVTARTAESGKAFAAEWRIPHWSTSLEESLERPGVDAVIITTPSGMHADQTVMALDRGKHVQVEIPMSLNLPDAQRIVDAATR